jgi:hypothetical protein
MNNQEIKQKIQDYFVKIDDDKFTKIKYIKANHSIKLNYKGLYFSVQYRRKDEIDMFFFIFSHFDKIQLNLRNAKMYMILDDDKSIELSESSGYKYEGAADFELTTIQIAVSVPDYISIVNASKFEYSFRCDDGKVEGLLTKNDKYYLQGFYNSTFDDEFELLNLLKFIENVAKEVNIFELNKNFTSEKNKYIIEPDETIERIQSGLFAWTKKNKMDFNGDILFGLSPNSTHTYISNIFTTEGIYEKNGNFLSYTSKPEFKIKKGFLSKKLVDDISGFSIEIVSWDSHEIDILINYINYQIAEKES